MTLDKLPLMGNTTYYRERLQQAHELIEVLFRKLQDLDEFGWHIDPHMRKMIDEWFKDKSE